MAPRFLPSESYSRIPVPTQDDDKEEESRVPSPYSTIDGKQYMTYSKHEEADPQEESAVRKAVGTILTCVFFISLRWTRSLWLSVVITSTAAWLIHQLYWRRRNLPPGPLPLPFFGNALSMDLRNPAKTFAGLHAKYGPIFTVWMPNRPMVVLANHEVLKEALVRKGPSFAGRTQGYIWSMFTKNQDHGDGIILCEGERWAEIREFAHKIFRSMGLGRMQMEEKIKTHIDGMLKRIDSKFEGAKEAPIDMEEPISLCVAHIIQDFVMGRAYDFEDPAVTERKIKKFKGLIDKVLADVASKTIQMVNAYPWLAWLPLPALRRYKANGFSLQRYFLQAIHEHAENLSMDGEPRDFMEAYLREMTGAQKNNPHFNHFTLALASGDLWTGGMETTVTTIRWAIIYMLYYPDIQKRCREEVVKVFGSETPSYGMRKKLPFVEATINELLRVVNVLPWAIPHRTVEDVSVAGFQLPKGTTVLPQYGTVQFDPKYFSKPETFDPERFLDADGMFKKSPELNPFGMGKRTCLGENLARYELFLIFTTLLQKYEFLPIKGIPLPSLKRSEGMTNVPQNFQVNVKVREAEGLFNEEGLKKSEKKKSEKKKFKEPVNVKKADAKDPQYETLAEVKDDIFKG